MRDRRGRVIYVGKALSLKRRVRSYFQQRTWRNAPPKLRGLIRSVEDLDIVVLRSEAEAIITEGQFIKDYRPRYNSLFKDDKRFLNIRVNLNEKFPRFTACRLVKDDGATYFGPYASSMAARAALEFFERRFGLRRCRIAEPAEADHKHCLDDVIRYCSAPCIGKISPIEYRERVLEACAFLRGERPRLLIDLHEAMEKEAKALHFEKAAALRDIWIRLSRDMHRKITGHKTLAVKRDDAQSGIRELQRVLGLRDEPAQIEAFDISNISGTFAVGSMVSFRNGLPQKSRYRMFRIRTILGSDDPGMMAEVIRRRYSRLQAEALPLPNLVLVDGGITQVRATRATLNELGLTALPVAGLAKRMEEIYRDTNDQVPLLLPQNSPALKVLQCLRDEAHRFALTYHRRLRAKRISESVLDDVAGIGEKRKHQLLQHFGSVARLRRAAESEIAKVPGFGPNIAKQIKSALS